MSAFSTVGVDLAKTVIQIHGVDECGKTVVRRRFRRSRFLAFFERRPRCLIGMEACSGAHHRGRRPRDMGHKVRLMPPSHVKPYVKRGKTDAADAAAVREVVTRPSMRFVPVKSEAGSAALVLHRARDFLVGQVTQTGNAIGARMAEFGIITAKGSKRIADLAEGLDNFARGGPAAGNFSPARDHAARLGLTPKQRSTGGKPRSGRISKMGNRYIRRLLYLEAMARIMVRRGSRHPGTDWPARKPATKETKVVALAFANRMARTILALPRDGASYNPRAGAP